MCRIRILLSCCCPRLRRGQSLHFGYCIASRGVYLLESLSSNHNCGDGFCRCHLWSCKNARVGLQNFYINTAFQLAQRNEGSFLLLHYLGSLFAVLCCIRHAKDVLDPGMSPTTVVQSINSLRHLHFVCFHCLYLFIHCGRAGKIPGSLSFCYFRCYFPHIGMRDPEPYNRYRIYASHSVSTYRQRRW